MVDLDIDIWALGRVYGGKLDVTYLQDRLLHRLDVA